MTNPQRRSIETPDGPYVVYHRNTAGLPDAHQHPGGPWYFQPAYHYSGDVYSKGYPSPEAASEAAWAWAQQLQDEEREAAPLPKEDLPREDWWNECLRRYLVSVGEDPADYSLGGMQQLAPSHSPEHQR